MRAYKFRSADRMEFVFDILFNQRLYCAEWHTLNDPVEGVFVYSHSGQNREAAEDFMKVVQEEKTHLRVCSLSKTLDSHLLWAHYAGGFSGVAIEVELDENEPEIVDMSYRGVFAGVNESENVDPAIVAREVLSSKYDAWAYEQELRILTTETFYKPNFPIKRVIAGHRMPSALFDALRIVCERLDIQIARTGIGDEGIDADFVPAYGEPW